MAANKHLGLPSVALGLFLTALCIEPFICSPLDSPDNRIVGGSEVVPGSLPYMVALYMNVSGEIKFHCGGSIISPHHVLTAAHCVTGWHADRFWVIAGGHDLTSPPPGQVTVHVAEVTVHDLFNWVDNSAIPDNDIALLRLVEPLALGSGLEAVTVPDQDHDPEVLQQCIISGWGATEKGGPISSVLMSTNVAVVEQAYCIDSYGEELISENMMCAGYPLGQHDACGGDSGGPLVCDGVLQGIVSWGEGCGEPLLFGVYTRVAFYSDWIEKHNYVPK